MTRKKHDKKMPSAKIKTLRLLKHIFVDNAFVKLLAIVVSVALWLVIGYLF